MAVLLSTALLLLCIGLSTPEDLISKRFVLDKKPKRCSSERSYGMNAAVCHGLNLQTVPSNLRTNIEILDASFNRIRELYETTFVNYGYLKILYLEDNMIMYIENGTFSPLQYLEVIDLSSNSLDSIPRELQTLPNLRKLYMNNNRLTSLLGILDYPPSQSLEFLSLANCHLSKCPPLNAYPFLKNLNLSSNEISVLSTQQIAPACLLQSLDLTDNPHLFKDKNKYEVCDCVVLESWIETKHIHVLEKSKFSCPTRKYGELQDDPCANVTYPEESTRMFDACQVAMRIKQEIAESRTTWILVAVIFTCTLLSIFLILFWIHKRNRKKPKIDKKKPVLFQNSDVKETMMSKYESSSDVDS